MALYVFSFAIWYFALKRQMFQDSNNCCSCSTQNQYACTQIFMGVWYEYSVYSYTDSPSVHLKRIMMTSSNRNIFRVTSPLCWEYTGHRWILRTKASDGSFDVFFDLRLIKRLSKQSKGWWFETTSCLLLQALCFRFCNGIRLIKQLKTL